MALVNSTVSYRHFEMRRTVFCMGFLLFFAGFWMVSSFVTLSAHGQELVPLVAAEPQVDPVEEAVNTALTTAPSSDPYTIENIEVDVTASNAVEARESAFEAAQIKGYEMLAARFLTAEQMANFETPSIDAISTLVKDYEVTNEQLSSVRYKGVYKIRYSPSAFKGTPRYDNNVQVPTMASADSFAAQQGDMLVLPFHEINGHMTLWQQNPFLTAWSAVAGGREMMPAPAGATAHPIVPVGDVEDIAQLDEAHPLQYDPARLNAMRLRYEAKQAVILVATEQQMPDRTINVLVDIYKAQAYGPERYRQVALQSFQGEAQTQFYNRVVAEVQKTLAPMMQGAPQPSMQPRTANNNYPMPTPAGQSQNPYAARQAQINAAPQPKGPTAGTIVAQLTYNSVKQWVEAKRAIEHARNVNHMEVKSLSARQATVEIAYAGSVDELRAGLGQAGIGLNTPVTQSNIPVGRDVVYQLTHTAKRY